MRRPSIRNAAKIGALGGASWSDPCRAGSNTPVLIEPIISVAGYRVDVLTKIKTGHCYFQNQPLGSETGQYPRAGTVRGQHPRRRHWPPL